MKGRSKLSGLRATVRQRPIILLVLVGLLLRVAWLLYARPEPVSDYLGYRIAAFNLLDEGFFGIDESSALQMPGHPVFLAAISLISRATLWLSLVMVLLSTAMCWLVYRLAGALDLSQRAALVAAGLCAVAPPFVVYAPVLASEHLFVVLLLSTLLAAIAVAGEVSWRVAATGALLGLTVLVRGEALFYVPVVAAVLWLATRKGHRVATSALLVGGLLVPLVPWMVRNMVVVEAGPVLSTTGGVNFYFGHNPVYYGWTTDVPWAVGDDLEANRLGWELGLEYVVDNPGSLLVSAFKGTRRQYSAPTYTITWNAQRPVGDELDFEEVPLRLFNPAQAAVVGWSSLSLSLAAAALLLWRRWSVRMRLVVAGMAITNFLGYVVLFFGDPRFRYSLDAVLAIPGALVLVALWDAGRSTASPTDAEHG